VARASKTRRRQSRRKGGGFDDLAVLHFHEPRVGVPVGLSVQGESFAVEQRDDRVSVAVQAAHGRDERLRQPGASRTFAFFCGLKIF
jgi:hypothetical protein